jgi:hypothetical protein
MRSLLPWIAVPTALLVTTTGCMKATGNLLGSTTNAVVLPEVMALGDLGMGCASGEALGGMIAAYGKASKKAMRASVMTMESAAMCLDDDVWEAELEARRAYRDGDIPAWHDAKAREQRAHLIAAGRYRLAFDALQSAYGVPEPGEDCPKLSKSEDQLTYLLGLSAGVLAVVNDMGADGKAGVPLSIPAAVVRGADCLDDDAWWGAPKALQASIYALQPGLQGTPDPWATFTASVAKGKAAHVRLADAFLAQTAATIGREDLTRAAIAEHAATVAESPADPSWKMLDVYATELVRHESDKIWTSAVGYRTPFGELGTFPGAPVAEEPPLPPLDLDDL